MKVEKKRAIKKGFFIVDALFASVVSILLLSIIVSSIGSMKAKIRLASSQKPLTTKKITPVARLEPVYYMKGLTDDFAQRMVCIWTYSNDKKISEIRFEHR